MSIAASSPKSSELPERIRRVSERMALVLALAMVIGVAVFGWYALDADLVRQLALAAVGPDVPISFSPATRSGFVAVMVVELAFYLVALEMARRLFLAYARGALFGGEPALWLGRLGLAVALIAPAAILARTVKVLVLTAGNPPGERYLAIGVSGTDLALITAGVLFLVIGWVMAEAGRVADENSQFV